MLTLHFSPFPTIKTERLILRRLDIEDENEIFRLRSDEAVNKYVDRPKPASITDARNHIEKVNAATDNNQSVFWGISLLTNPPIIGTICLWNISKEDSTAEVGFDLAPEFQGKGIMTEALSAVMGYAFETIKVKRLVGWVHHENAKSISLLSKFNFIRNLDEEKRARETDPMPMGLENLVFYTLNAQVIPTIN